MAKSKRNFNYILHLIFTQPHVIVNRMSNSLQSDADEKHFVEAAPKKL